VLEAKKVGGDEKKFSQSCFSDIDAIGMRGEVISKCKLSYKTPPFPFSNKLLHKKKKLCTITKRDFLRQDDRERN
jgi:hypothetical protein